MKLSNWLVLFAVLAVAVPVHGYGYATSIIHKYVERCGAYPTLDEAIQANWRHNGFEPTWFEEYIKGQNSDRVPYTWYVVYKIRPEFQADQRQAVQNLLDSGGRFCGGSFYEHTRQGWVGMPEHFLNAFGYLDLWMWVYHLYGGEL